MFFTYLIFNSKIWYSYMGFCIYNLLYKLFYTHLILTARFGTATWVFAFTTYYTNFFIPTSFQQQDLVQLHGFLHLQLTIQTFLYPPHFNSKIWYSYMDFCIYNSNNRCKRCIGMSLLFDNCMGPFCIFSLFLNVLLLMTSIP